VSSAAGDLSSDKKNRKFGVVRARLARMLDAVGDSEEPA
jgi:hypothetical protein